MAQSYKQHISPLFEKNRCFLLGTAIFCLVTITVPQPAAALDIRSLGGVSVRELLDLRDVSVTELADIAAPAIVEPATPTQALSAPKALATNTGIQIRVSPSRPSEARVVIAPSEEKTEIQAIAPAIVSKSRVSTLTATDVKSVNGVVETLRVSIEDGQLKVTPDKLKVAGIGARVAISLGEAQPNLVVGRNASFFVRDQDVAEWDSDTKEFTAKGQGKTEIFVVAAGHMQIVPITVSKESPRDALVAENRVSPKLKAPAELMELDPQVRSKATLQASLGDESELASGDDKQSEDTPKAPSSEEVPADSAQSDEASKNSSAGLSAEEDELSEKKFYRDISPVGYASLTVQVIDDRSSISANRLYPVSGVNVRIAGTEYLGKTDASGRVHVKEVPRNSRFYVTVDDPYGRIKPSYSEVVTAAKASGDIPVKVIVMRQMNFDAMTQIAGLAQNAGAASVCGRAVARQGKTPLSGVRIRTDVPGEGPYYFNSLGLMDPAVAETGKDGRFCIFNIEPGPLMLSFLEGQDLAANMVIPTFAGRHLEESFELGEESPIVTGIASVSPVEDQLGADSIAANKLSPIEYTDLIPIGDQVSMERKQFGVLTGRGIAQSYHGQSLVVSQSSVFEPAVYSFSGADPQDATSPVVVPLLPRGFIEDMSVFAQSVQDPTLGSVVVEHGIQDALGKEPLTFRLVSDRGEEVGTGWYYADFPVAKAIFFNVPPGNYSLIVETGSKYWISSTTVAVYSEHAAVVSTGKRVRQQAERYTAQRD